MKKTRAQYLKSWKQHVKMVMDTTHINEEEAEDVKSERRVRLEAEPEDWFGYYFPRYTYAAPAPFHKEATKRILEHPEWYEVRMWSRELAKSTRTMMEVLYLTLVGHACSFVGTDNQLVISSRRKRYVLLVSNSEDNAQRLLLPYKANLEFNKRIIQDYGAQVNLGNWQAGEFTTQQGVAYRALGAGQSPRGTRNEEVRPDIILFDDIDTDADCLNPEIISRKWRWIEEAAIGTRSVSQPTTIIFCGNRIAPDCCIQRAVRLADHVDEINIRDAAGESSWPEKNSTEDIDRVLAQKSYAAQQKEYFNNPVTEGSVFDKLAYKPARPLNEYKLLLCYTDPSYKATNDYKATVLVGNYNNEWHILKCFLAQATTAEMIGWHYHIMDLVGSNTCYYFMEEVFMQDVIIKEVSDAGLKKGRTIPIRGDTRRKPEKFMRIESLLEPLNRNGQLYFNQNEKSNPHMVRLAEQFLVFAPGSRAHDDGPDAVEGAIWKMNEILSRTAGKGIVSWPKQSNQNRL
jgi:hypothetical protein